MINALTKLIIFLAMANLFPNTKDSAGNWNTPTVTHDKIKAMTEVIENEHNEMRASK